MANEKNLKPTSPETEVGHVLGDATAKTLGNNTAGVQEIGGPRRRRI